MRLFASLYLDEDVSILVAEILRARGFDVVTARDEKMLGRSDSEQLEKAISLHRCLFTHNRIHYEELHRKAISGEKRHLASSSARAATCMNWLAALPRFWIH